MRRARGLLVVATVVALAAGACGGPSKKARGAPANASDCGLDALAKARKPVEITFWHTMARANAEWLVRTIDEFNASQRDVHVRLVQYPSYQDVLTKYLAGIASTKDLPDVVQLEETTVQKIVDSKSVVPMQACVGADHYDLSTFLPRSTAYYSYKGVLESMPWAVSNPILMYDAGAFTKAGLDPSRPPKTLDEVRTYAQRIVASGAATHGIALRVEPYVFEFLNAKSGGTYVNNGNGRDARATAATLDTPVAREIWTWWKQMVDSGLALNTGGTPGNIDHMLAIGNHEAAMVMEASGVLGTVRQVLESGQFPGVKVAAAPLPALRTGGGVPVGDGALWIPKASSLEKRAAAWQLVKFLVSPEQQAALAVAGGYVPVRTEAPAVPALRDKWAADPIFRVGYDQLVSGPVDRATVGSLIGDYQGVRDAVKNAMLAMLTGGLSPEAALRRAQRDATDAIRTYNERLGVS